MDDFLTDLKKSVELKRKITDPRTVATHYLGHTMWKLHEELYKTVENTNLKRVVVIAPRDHGKSEVFTHTLPLWSYLNNRDVRILIAAKSKDQATKFLSVIKQDFEKNEKIKKDFGDLKDNPWQDSKIYLKRNPTVSLKDPSVEAVGVLGGITGAHFDLIVCDDLLDDENTRTERKRQSVMTWFKGTLEPLLEPNGRLFVVGTRKHYKDMYQYLLNNDVWKHLECQYNIAGDHRRCGYKSIIKEPKYDITYDHENKINDIKIIGDYSILLPEKFTITELIIRKISMGSQLFNSEYQNDPTGLEGLLLDEEWLQYYTSVTDLDKLTFKMRVMAFDLAISEKDIEGGDYFAGIFIGLTNDNKFYILDYIREHLDFPSQVRKIQSWYDLQTSFGWKPDVVIIETNAYQKALSQHLKSITTLPILEKKQDKDKYTRLLEISPYFESKRVFMREDMTDIMDEYKMFPRGDHEDLLDAIQMAMSEIIKRSTDYEFFGWRPGWLRKKDESEYISSKHI